ncbi:MAG: hypothetical protein J6K43_09315 [Lachnospiraceae bacterium]|nr:hypothetical protein [Lachnospiraceae bacterium]
MILYNFFVRKNKHVQYEYERYVMEHLEDHYGNRLKHWKILWSLNVHYRIKKKTEPMIYINEMSTCKDEDTRLKTEENSKLLDSKTDNLNSRAISNSKNADKLPYLDGSESKLYIRRSPHYACRNLVKYDIISFDIFDTLIFRPFSKPSDLFMILGERLHIQNFKTIRVNAEKMARERHNATYGNTEIQIGDIYEIVEVFTGVPKDIGIKQEFEVELEFCRPNPYCKRLFDLLAEQGKRIIACSDMYLPKNYVVQLLEKCGYFGFEDIYVSCDYTFSKRSGGMYKMLINKYPNCSIVHMGDNYKVDVVCAKECGLEAIFSKNVNLAGMQYRATDMSPLIGSAYAGIVNMHLHNGLYSYEPQYEYGYIYGGIYVLGYCNWIYRHALEHNIDTILFLSRDGDIYKKVFDYLYPNMKTKYAYWSRIAGQKYSFEHDFNDFINKMLIHKINNPINHDTIGDLLSILSLEDFKKDLARYRLTAEEELSENNKNSLIIFFSENRDAIITYFEKEREELKELYESYIGDAKKISIVDVGWIGSGPLGIKYLINDVWKKDVKVFCLVAANRHYNSEANATTIACEDVESYLFNSTFNVELLKIHSSTNKNTNNLFFEQFTQAQMPSFEGFDKKGNFIFDLPEVENYQMISEIHNGIFDFVKEYKEIFGNYDYMFNISGHDAYMPFRLIIKNLKFIKNNLGKMTYSRTVGSNKRDNKIETLGDILESLSL